MKIDGWTITVEPGCGRPPECREMDFFCIVGPHVSSETRVDGDGLKMILPPNIYAEFMAQREGTADA